MSLVDPARPDAPATTRRATRGTVLVSMGLHVIVLAAAVVVPLFGHVVLPGVTDARRPEAFVRAAAVPPAPPPPALATPSPASTSKATSAPVTSAPATAPVPLAAPDRLSAGEPPAYVPGTRLSGSVPASALAGVESGLPGLPAVAAEPPAPPVTSGPLRVGGDIRPPRKLRHVAPVYPTIAAHAQIKGTVILEATIAPSGDIVDVRVLRSVPLLDAAAVDAVRQWRYEPTRLNGTPVAVLLTVTVRFGP